jgi:hypothetical protein
MKKTSFLIQFLFLFATCIADDFKWKSQIDSVSKSGFYKIVLSPAILSKTKENFSDLRIFDSKHHEVPYLFVSENQATEQTEFKPYTILENNYISQKKITRIVIHNQKKEIISSFVLQIRNSEIEKEITLKGSDNQKSWFIIKRNYPVLSSNNLGKTSELRIIDFPKSNYEYFEITLNDKHKDPLQIMAVGHYDSEVNQGLYTPLPAPTVSQTDSLKLKKSYVKLKFNSVYEIDRLNLHLKGPAYFLRNCTIGTFKEVNHKKVFYTIHSFVISSERPTLWNVNGLKTDELLIEIENEDNVPVRIYTANAYQLSKYLIANLSLDEKYELFLGKEKIASPNYDLKYFTNKIPKTMEVIKTGSMIMLSAIEKQNMPDFFNKKTIWIALILVTALLFWMTIKITREMRT